MDKINVCINDFSIGVLEKSVSQEQAEVEADVQAKAKPAVAIRNPNFVDPGMETDNEYNKTHEMTRDEVSFNSKP